MEKSDFAGYVVKVMSPASKAYGREGILKGYYTRPNGVRYAVVDMMDKKHFSNPVNVLPQHVFVSVQ